MAIETTQAFSDGRTVGALWAQYRQLNRLVEELTDTVDALEGVDGNARVAAWQAKDKLAAAALLLEEAVGYFDE